MVRAGLLSDEQLAAVQATSAERKLSFVEALLTHGFADEDSVVGFLHSKLMIPKVGASILEGVDRSALDRVPGELAARHAVLPISSDETGNLTLAMVDPTDMKAVDAISAHTGAYLVRAVAPLRVIRSSIHRHYGIEAPPLPNLQAGKSGTAPTPAAIIPPTASVPNASSSTSRAGSAPSVTPPSVTPPSVTAPTIPGVSPPAIDAPVVTVPGASAPRPSAPSGGAIRPAAVLQPSAVFMPGAPRPAAVLPAAAFAPSPYGIPVQPAVPVVIPPTVDPVPAPAVPSVSSPAGNVTQAFGSSSLSASIPAPAVPSVSPPSGNVTQQLVSSSLAPPPAASTTTSPPGTVTQPFGSSSLAATAPVPAASPAPAATPVPSASPVNGAVATPAASAATAPVPAASPLATAESEATVARSNAPTMPAFSGAMATLRPVEGAAEEPMDASSRARTLPGSDDAADTLTGGSRSSDVVDIPLDDLETTERNPTIVPGEAASEQAFDAAKTATWIPPSFTAANEIIPLSPEAFHRLLPRFATVKSRDEVTDLLLDFLAEGFSRVIMFVHVKGEIRGRDARGEDLLVEAVRQIRIPAGGPSVFSGVIERRTPYFGSMRTDTPIDAAFFSALGGVEGVILVLPVLLRDKVPLIVFASGSSNPVDPRSLHELTHEVAAALERIIVLEKSRGK